MWINVLIKLRDPSLTRAIVAYNKALYKSTVYFTLLYFTVMPLSPSRIF